MIQICITPFGWVKLWRPVVFPWFNSLTAINGNFNAHGTSWCRVNKHRGKRVAYMICWTNKTGCFQVKRRSVTKYFYFIGVPKYLCFRLLPPLRHSYLPKTTYISDSGFCQVESSFGACLHHLDEGTGQGGHTMPTAQNGTVVSLIIFVSPEDAPGKMLPRFNLPAYAATRPKLFFALSCLRSFQLSTSKKLKEIVTTTCIRD